MVDNQGSNGMVWQYNEAFVSGAEKCKWVHISSAMVLGKNHRLLLGPTPRSFSHLGNSCGCRCANMEHGVKGDTSS